MNIKRYILSGLLIFSLWCPSLSVAQEIIQIEPLFEYPSAPESLTSLEEKSNYLLEHFWDNMDFKSKTAVDQNALNDAMKVFSVPLRWADMTKADIATNKLIERISKNPTLLTQFTKAAEENLYGPRAEYWYDPVYKKFLEAFLKNKKIPDSRKRKYQKQLTTLNNSVIGQKAHSFKFTGKNGKEASYMPMSTQTLIIIGDPTQPDWRLARLKMETIVPLRQAVDDGKLNILFIIPFEMENWERETDNYPDNWTVGIAPEIGSVLDLRGNPSVYLIGSDGNLLMKNVSLEKAVNEALNAITN